MDTTSHMPGSAEQSSKQSIGVRFLLFLAGAVLNYLLISTPLKYLKHNHPGLPDMVTTGLSVIVGMSFFFLWNYFVNFRTGSRKRDALVRYIIAAATLGGLQWLVLWTFTHLDKNPYVYLGALHFIGLSALHINRDVVAAQLCLGGFKFLVYHYWAFPTHDEAAG